VKAAIVFLALIYAVPSLAQAGPEGPPDRQSVDRPRPAGPAVQSGAPGVQDGRLGPLGSGVQIGVDEHPGAQVPLALTFVNPDGGHVALRDLIDRTAPTLLVLAYFRCPMLCDQIVGGLARSLPAMRTSTGENYRALVVSFDPRDTPADARAKAATLLGPLSAFERAHWRFVTDDEGSAARLADAVGFRYRFDPTSDQYAHPAVAIAISPQGRIARYVYGVSFPTDVLAPALRDAAAGQAHGSVSRILLTCFLYLPSLRRHAAAVEWVLRGGTTLAFGALALSLVVLVRKQRRGATPRENHGPGID
jgi:protein SCO1/2